MEKSIQISRTNQVVHAASIKVSRDVRQPKVVRDGVVKLSARVRKSK